MTAPRDVISFAEKVLELIDEGRYTATYKYAVLLGLIDLCLERTQASGTPPALLTTRQLSEKIIEIYWPHTLPFANQPPSILRQNVGGQAEILSEIVRFRERYAADPSIPRWQARHGAAGHYELLTRRVEWKLIQMPLPRLQMIGQSSQTAAIRAGLWTTQDRRCFYGDHEVRERTRTHVDHFIPWSRYPDDALDNLVVSDVRCNGFKGNSLAAATHVARWVRRFEFTSGFQMMLGSGLPKGTS